MANYGFLQLVSQSAFTALSTGDIKSHLNISDSSTDTYLQSLLDTAVVYCERHLQLDLRSTTWKLVLDQFPIWGNYQWMDRWGNYVYVWPWVSEFAVGRVTQKWQEISLKRGPITGITSIQYYDVNNALQTVDSSTYRFATPSYQPARVEPVLYWPVAYPRPDAVAITFTVGFSTPPATVLHAIKLLVGKWWALREDIAYGPDTAHKASDEAVNCLLDQFRVYSYG